MTEKKEKSKIEFIKWFSELNKTSGNIAGGKGANLSEIYNLKVQVPPGFVVTAQAYDYFIKEAGLKEKIKNLLEKLDYENTKQLDEITQQIRLSIVNAKLPEEMKEDIIDAYEHLDVDEFEIQKGAALDILKNSAEPIFVAVRSSATTEDLAEASFAGQQDSFVNIKGKHELLKHIKKCFASLFTARATYYRNKKGFKHEEASLAVVIQKMVDSEKSGVIFSKDPSYKNDNLIIEAVFGLGEGIVSGRITPDKYVVSKEQKIIDKKISDKKIAITRDSGGSRTIVKLREEKSKSPVLTDHEIKKLAEIGLKLEDHYQKPQDIEFAIEREEIYIVQTRPVTTMGKRIEKEAHEEIIGEPILTGLAASPGIASGKIKIIERMEDLSKINEGDILVTKMTNPDMVVTMQKSAAIVTDEGGLTAHAAIVSREMGVPCVVATKVATTKLKENEIITVDGFKGKIYKGKVAEATKKEILPVTAHTKTKIKVIVDLPGFAERAAKTGLKEIGLTRIEGIIAEGGMHPQYFLEQNKIKDYEELIFKGIKKISEYFEEIWVRTSDIRSDEFRNLKGAPKEKEANPMLGMHGIRYSLKYPEVLKAELNALKRVAEINKKIGILFPQVISVEELQKVKAAIKEINFLQVKVGVMVETPAAVQLIRELCDEGIDFISFGTNDLTQYILALDRGNEQVQELYDEMHPAVLHQLEYVIRVCKRNHVETSICGQAGSKKEMVKFLVEKGIDSISVNADVANDIANYVAELEGKPVEKKDEKVEEKVITKNTEEPKEENKEKMTEIQEEETPKNTEAQEKPKQEVVEEKSEPEHIDSQEMPVEEAVEMIEEEKQEYLQEHPEELNEGDKQKVEESGEESSEGHPEESKNENLDIF